MERYTAGKLCMYVLNKALARHIQPVGEIVMTLPLHPAVYRVRQMQTVQDVNFIN
jgi:hypothetical protein